MSERITGLLLVYHALDVIELTHRDVIKRVFLATLFSNQAFLPNIFCTLFVRNTLYSNEKDVIEMKCSVKRWWRFF